MPTINRNTFKCDSCRKDFVSVWVPNKLCCRIAMAERCGNHSNSRTYSRHLTNRRGQESCTPLSSSEYCSKMSNKTGKKLISGTTSGPKSGQASAETTMRNCRNCIAPFSSLGKPTCGHFFSRQTDHRKKKIGIPPSNLVQWRSYVS